jgi:hypothetical protein
MINFYYNLLIELCLYFYIHTYQYWYTVNYDYKFKLHWLETKSCYALN